MKTIKQFFLITVLTLSNFCYSTAVTRLELRGHQFNTNNAGRHTFATQQLFEAAKSRHFLNLRSAIGHQAKLDATYTTQLKYTALHFAILNNWLDGVKLLLKNNPSSFIDKQDHFGYTALHYAAKNGNSALVQILVQNGAKLELTSYQYEETPAVLALVNGNDACVILIEEEILRRERFQKRKKTNQQCFDLYKKANHYKLKDQAFLRVLEEEQTPFYQPKNQKEKLFTEKKPEIAEKFYQKYKPKKNKAVCLVTYENKKGEETEIEIRGNVDIHISLPKKASIYIPQSSTPPWF